MKNNKNHLRLFVYGTLKRGFWNHDRFCSQAVSIEPATTWGRLYHLPAGFPALEVPETCILAHGTEDPIADARTQNSTELSGNAMAQPDGDWDLVAVEMQNCLQACWTYHGLNHIIQDGLRLFKGYWKGRKLG